MNTKVLAGWLFAVGSGCSMAAFAQDAAVEEATPTLVEEAVVTTAVPDQVDATTAAPATMESAAVAPRAALVPADQVFTNPKQIQVVLGRFVEKEAHVVLLPTMQLHWIVRNKLTATGGVVRKHKSSKEIVVPVDRVVLERVLATLQNDLAARFEAIGWDVRTRSELGADLPEVKGLRTNAELGVPTYRSNNTINDQDWAAIALPGAEPVDPKSIGNGMAWMRYARGKTGLNLNVTYMFAAGLVGETKSRQLGTVASPSLWFGARTEVIGTTSNGFGSIAIQPEGLVVDEDVGTLDEIAGSRAGTAENVVRYLGGMGGRDRTGYEMAPDWSKAEAAMVRAGRSYNAEVVKRLVAGS